MVWGERTVYLRYVIYLGFFTDEGVQCQPVGAMVQRSFFFQVGEHDTRFLTYPVERDCD